MTGKVPRGRRDEAPMGPETRVRVVYYNQKRVPDPLAAIRELPWQEYHAARNRIVRLCRAHAPTGPMGECPIRPDREDLPDVMKWGAGDPDPTYFVVDDQWNHERYIYIEILRVDGATLAWITALLRELEDMPGWGVCITGLDKGYVIILRDVILVTGPSFRGTSDLAGVVHDLREDVAAYEARRAED